MNLILYLNEIEALKLEREHHVPNVRITLDRFLVVTKLVFESDEFTKKEGNTFSNRPIPTNFKPFKEILSTSFINRVYV